MGSLSQERIFISDSEQHESLHFESGGGGRHWGCQALDRGPGCCRGASEERHRCGGWRGSRWSCSSLLPSTCCPPPCSPPCLLRQARGWGGALHSGPGRCWPDCWRCHHCHRLRPQYWWTETCGPSCSCCLHSCRPSLHCLLWKERG